MIHISKDDIIIQKHGRAPSSPNLERTIMLKCISVLLDSNTQCTAHLHLSKQLRKEWPHIHGLNNEAHDIILLTYKVQETLHTIKIFKFCHTVA